MKGMTIIVKKTTQLIAGMIFMYGIYVITHGHLTPGGGFAGGVIIAGAFILITLAFGSDVLKLVKEELGTTMVESLATITVVLIGSAGFIFGTRAFFNNYLPKGQHQSSQRHLHDLIETGGNMPRIKILLLIFLVCHFLV